MNFIETIFQNLSSKQATERDRFSAACLIEVHGKKLVSTTAEELLENIRRARAHLDRSGVKPGDRVVLLAPNSAEWVACDLAILAHGAVCVPLYSRQDPKELAFMANDCQPKWIIASDSTLADGVKKAGASAPAVTFEEVFRTEPADLPAHPVRSGDIVTIVYTSGTSGEPKGALITCGGADYMLRQTISRLKDALGHDRNDTKVFHFLPVCFMGSRIMLWTQLFRGNPVMLSTDLSKLVEEIGTADPEYYLNVPAVLERIRSGVTQQIRKKGRLIWWMYQKGFLNRMIRKKIGKSLKFLICGSAALSEETQRWFERIGITVLQVYGLTETTAIVTMDKPGKVKPGYVGYPIDGCETMLTEEGELICRGPNIFAGYWNRPEATHETLRNGWLYTGDQAELDASGNIRIVGRVKNILVPASGHNVAPEPIEQSLIEACPGAEHVVLIGHGRPYLAALITGDILDSAIADGLEKVNAALPHYRKIRKFHRAAEKLTIENGLLTANQKLRRKAIEARFKDAIDRLYREEEAA